MFDLISTQAMILVEASEPNLNELIISRLPFRIETSKQAIVCLPVLSVNRLT